MILKARVLNIHKYTLLNILVSIKVSGKTPSFPSYCPSLIPFEITVVPQGVLAQGSVTEKLRGRVG